MIENILQMLDSRWDYTYYRSATGVEVDLILHTHYQEIWAIEIKRSSIPKLSRGFTEACEDTQAMHKMVITAEQGTYPMPNGVEVMGLMDFLAYLKGRLG